MLSIKLNLLFYDITKLQLDWTLDGDGTPLYMTGILQASLPTFTKLALPGTIVLHKQIICKLGLSQYTDRSPLELSVYRWVYLVKATLIWFMVVKVETILPMEITATCSTLKVMGVLGQQLESRGLLVRFFSKKVVIQ